jgi:hypothetical protein
LQRHRVACFCDFGRPFFYVGGRFPSRRHRPDPRSA